MPVSVYTKIREEHDAQTTKFQQSYAYSGGMAQVVLEKVQAEPGQAPERDGNGDLVIDQGALVFSDTSPDLRWIGNGRVIVDNKGTDARDNTAEVRTFAPGGLQLETGSVDAGTRWALPNAVGNPLRTWDSRDHCWRWSYDALNRPTHAYVKHDVDDELLRERTVYGESLGVNAVTDNHRGQVYGLYDTAGELIFDAYDFKGNLLQQTRRFASDYTTVVDWIDLAPETVPASIASTADPLLDSETFVSAWSFDGMSRVATMTTPDDSETAQTYSRRGAGPGLLVSTIVQRWQDHLPLNRQESIYAREVATNNQTRGRKAQSMGARAITEDKPCEAFWPARSKFEELVKNLQSERCRGMTHDELEVELAREGRELLRRMYQGHLDWRGPGPVSEPVVGADGVERTQRRKLGRKLNNVFGSVVVSRFGYGAARTTSLFPLEAELNMAKESYSLGVRYKVAKAAAEVSFDSVGTNIADMIGYTVPKRQLEQLAVRASVDFDEFYAQQPRSACDPDALRRPRWAGDPRRLFHACAALFR